MSGHKPKKSLLHPIRDVLSKLQKMADEEKRPAEMMARAFLQKVIAIRGARKTKKKATCRHSFLSPSV